MKHLKRLWFFGIVAILSACDCIVYQYGIVVDSETGQPIEGAVVKLSHWQDTTNSNGEFEIDDMKSVCPDHIVLVQKEGYRDFEIEVSRNEKGYEYSVKSDYAYHEYPEPVPSTFNPKN